ncbi:hypothetical protein HPP92_016991 [Vanilla planifolia]|uniref:Fe2OG dioxygenase domain-containing protein n=1 Tax=Vanilla planifolia TaxID=51239 RepID=A0A835USP0_VANPL|nr:hypothetical protein HPP92_016991 [Vanilla planifolia]
MVIGEEEAVPNLVQEIALSGHEPPAKFFQKEENSPVAAAPLASDIPIIDLVRLFQLDSDQESGRLKMALETWGLFHVVSDQLSVSFLDEVRGLAKKFFYLPKEEKLRYRNLTDDGEFKLEGYGNDRIASEDQVLDWNDRLYLLVQPENERNLQLWPETPSSFRSVLHKFSIELRKVANIVLKAIALALELEENYFTDRLGDDASAYARFNYYPSCPKSDVVLGMKPHSDGSVLTILLLDKDVDGIQVLKDGEWFTVPIVPHAVLVNLGDQLEIMSNGIFKSPVHRVVTNTQKERISMAMFYSCNAKKYIEPASCLADETRPKLYKKVMVEEYLGKLFEAFAQGKRAIDFAKI